MMYTKEADLNLAVLIFATRCVVEGDQQMLASLGFKPCDVSVLKELSTAQLNRIATTRGHILNEGCIDRESFYRVIAYSKDNIVSDHVCDYLIKNEAPLAMLRTLYGFSQRELAERRRLLAAEGKVGRTEEPTPEEEGTIWHAYKATGKDHVDTLTPEDWMELHRKVKISLRKIWILVNRW